MFGLVLIVSLDVLLVLLVTSVALFTSGLFVLVGFGCCVVLLGSGFRGFCVWIVIWVWVLIRVWLGFMVVCCGLLASMGSVGCLLLIWLFDYLCVGWLIVFVGRFLVSLGCCGCLWVPCFC